MNSSSFIDTNAIYSRRDFPPARELDQPLSFALWFFRVLSGIRAGTVNAQWQPCGLGFGWGNIGYASCMINTFDTNG